MKATPAATTLGPLAASRILFALVVLLAATYAAALPVADPATAAQRERFVAAERALALGRLDEYRRLLARLDDYPLRSYLLIDEVERRLASAADAEIGALVNAWADTPRGERLRRRWLARSAERGAWRDFLDGWREQRDEELRCHHARALYASGDAAAADAATEALWLSARSRHKACDRPFALWRERGRLSEALLWRRVSLAASAGESRLVRYLARGLAARDAAIAELWLAVRKDPSLVGDDGRFRGDEPRLREVRLFGLQRLARRHPAAAARAWQAMADRHAWTERERNQALRAVGLGYAQEHLSEGRRWLDRVDDAHADARVWQWRALVRLRDGDWPALVALIERMPAEQAEAETWRYWRARALELSGAPEAAARLYEGLAVERSFHGFLAADRLQRPYHMQPQLLRFEQASLAATARLPGIARARELLALGRELDARREWYSALEGLADETLRRAARLAQLWGWHTEAIFTVARAGHFDDTELRFPLLFTREFGGNAAQQGVEAAWVLAVARQESAFNADARSSAGALGLMQIMPRTGRAIARQLAVPFRGNSTLLDPEVSIRFGAYYLRRLLDRFSGHMALATAAYNAGPSRAEAWRPSERPMDADVWVDTIPYDETRRYLQRIFYYTAIYEHRLGTEPRRLSERLPPVPARPQRAAIADPPAS